MRQAFYIARFPGRGWRATQIGIFHRRPRFVTKTERQWDYSRFPATSKDVKVKTLVGVPALQVCARGLKRLTGASIKQGEIRKVRLASL